MCKSRKPSPKPVAAPGARLLGLVTVGQCPKCGRLLNWTLTGDLPLRHTASCCGTRYTVNPQ